jgi:hypothetical protein
VRFGPPGLRAQRDFPACSERQRDFPACSERQRDFPDEAQRSLCSLCSLCSQHVILQTRFPRRDSPDAMTRFLRRDIPDAIPQTRFPRRSPVSGLRSPVSRLRSPVSGLQSPISNLQSPISNLQSSISRPTTPTTAHFGSPPDPMAHRAHEISPRRPPWRGAQRFHKIKPDVAFMRQCCGFCVKFTLCLSLPRNSIVPLSSPLSVYCSGWLLLPMVG